ncbi:MAG: Rieske 2Fe-2S domain-containing protein [Mariprofundales bacterium]
MAEWIDVLPVAALPSGERQVVVTTIGSVALFNLEGELLAIEDRCSHDGGDLACGEWVGDEIVCPRHGARFSLHSGMALSPPAYEGIETFAVRCVAGMIQIDLDGA